ncbi:MAG TPA: hypothetical protein GX497_17885 [Bacillus bacterium]|nr:hypothetical protein [Bacillus sp. (in: firmicutes)]
MLKKSLSVVLGFVLVLMLAACNQTAQPTEKSNNVSKSNLTVEQLFERSTEASATIKSFTVDMDMKQNMSGVPEVGDMVIDSKIEMQFVTDPIQMYQKLKMNMGEEVGNIDTEVYLTKDGMFMYEPTQGGWMKFPTNMSEELMNLSNQQGNPLDELKKLQSFIDDFSYEEDNKNYILKLTASGDKLTQFIKETMQSLSPELAENEMLTEGMKINNMKYEIAIDKETYLPNQLHVVMDLDFTMEGETMRLSQTVNGVYTSYNEIDSITVPKDVLDNAVEMDM